jgi:hypothetical protein
MSRTSSCYTSGEGGIIDNFSLLNNDTIQEMYSGAILASDLKHLVKARMENFAYYISDLVILAYYGVGVSSILSTSVYIS